MDEEKSKRISTKRLLALPIAAAIILIFILLWHVAYNHTVDVINTVQTTLIKTPSEVPQNMPWLAQLTVLKKVLTYLDQPKVLRYRWVGLSQTQDIYKAANAQYHAILHTKFLPYLESTLQQHIQLGLKRNKLALFDALKVYLTITSSSHYDKNVILSWYRRYWNLLYPHNAVLVADLLNYLHALLASNTALWEANPVLVQQAQKALQSLPLADLAFLELQGECEPVNVPVFSKNNIAGLFLKNAKIPAFFSDKVFKEIYNQKIPQIKTVLAKGNWVLGTKQGTLISGKQEVELVKKLRSIYLKFYTSAWAKTIVHIQLMPETTLPEAQAAIRQIIDPQSPLMQRVNIVLGNAGLDGGKTIKANKLISAVKNWLYAPRKRALITKPLMALQAYLDKITKAKDVTRAAYMAAVKRFQASGAKDPITLILQQAVKYPEPIRSWLTVAAKNSWKALLVEAKIYLDAVWHSLILPVYTNKIRDRYPVFHDADETISLKNFNTFFGPNGTIGGFYIYYLQFFVDMEANYWTLKKLDGEGINISRKALNMFIRASLIQQMFFTENPRKPSFRFVFTPLSFSSNLNKITINFGRQVYNVYSSTKKSKLFSWSGTDVDYVSIVFTENDGSTRRITFHGPWALFRLLNKSTIQISADPKVYTVIFKSGEDTGSFALTTEHRVNPFVPGIISKFRVPDRL